ncbi:hypothetical protein [Rhodopirellula sp. MGV]|uniref:hypothetical protein n=1 Tax=Rhodopirellula sp. MGV TaxID=2023130 RepID=UPI000B969632|nr:hypothetical protein [Rhodopirellula sp. MGV]PNY34842.1 hypothetical protein C2E31_21615 [Rhodopirellula baltica]
MTRTSHHSSDAQIGHAEAKAIAIESSRLRQRAVAAMMTFILLVVMAMLASNASAQAKPYEVLDVDKQVQDNLGTVERWARSFISLSDLSAMPDNQQTAVRRYFQLYIPAMITQPDKLEKINETMAPAYATASRAVRSQSPGTRKAMGWLYAGMKRVATGNYHPPARINAISFICRLAAPSQGRGLPTPYPFILTDMKPIYLDKTNPEGVRAAALQGLEHYVRFGGRVDDASLAELTAAMNELLDSDPPAGRDPLAHAFMQRYAVSILSYTSKDAAIGKQFVSISTDEDKPNLIGLHSAAALASLPEAMKKGDVQATEVLQKWAGRLQTAFEGEIARLEAMEKKQKTQQQPAAPDSFLKSTAESTATSRRGAGMGMDMGMDMESMGSGYGSGYSESMDDPTMGYDMSMMGGSGMGMYGGGMRVTEKPQPPEVTASRKKLNFALQQIVLGLTGKPDAIEDADAATKAENIKGGLLAGASPNELTTVRAWITAMIDVQTALNDKSVGSAREFSKKLTEQTEVLASLSRGEAVKKKATTDQPFFFGNPEADASAAAPATEQPADDADSLEALMSQ